MKKTIVTVLVFAAVVSASFAVSARSSGEIGDSRVSAFANAFYQASGIGAESDFFTENCILDEKTGTWKMQIQYLNGSALYIDFGRKVINLTYVTAEKVGKDRLSQVLGQINTSRFYTPYTFCLPVVSPDGTLCFTYSLVDEGIENYGAWLYWHYRFFKSSSDLIIEDISI